MFLEYYSPSFSAFSVYLAVALLLHQPAGVHFLFYHPDRKKLTFESDLYVLTALP